MFIIPLINKNKVCALESRTVQNAKNILGGIKEAPTNCKLPVNYSHALTSEVESAVLPSKELCWASPQILLDFMCKHLYQCVIDGIRHQVVSA